MLEEVIHALEGDSLMLQSAIKPRVSDKTESINALLELIAFEQTKHDTIIMDYYSQMRLNPSLTFNIGPYESLKMNGLDKIKNDSIRLLLVKLYEFNLPRLISFFHSYENEYKEVINTTEKELFRSVIQESSNNTRSVIRLPKDGHFLQDPRLLEIIRMEQKDANHKNYRLRVVIRVTNFNLKLLKSYIKDIKL